MKTLKVTNINRNYSNWGMHCEQALAYTLTGELRSHDHVPFFADSDIPEFEMSVKSNSFTLASAKVNFGSTFEEKWQDFKARVHSTQFAYVTEDFIAYIMSLDEFERFVHQFCYLDRESTKNGGGLKIKCRKESTKMLKWLTEQVAA